MASPGVKPRVTPRAGISSGLPGPDAAVNLLASLVLEDGRTWGEAATADQWEDAHAILGNGDSRPYHFITRARGYSKTTDLAGMVLAAMLVQLPPNSRCYALAADKDQGQLLLDSLRGFLQRTPGLHGVSAVLDLSSYRVLDRRTGSSLDVLAADAAGTYGKRPDFLVIDEVAQWTATPDTKKLILAARTAMGKVRASRMVVLTTAGDPGHWSYKMLEHARRHPLWRVHEIPGPPPWMDSDRLEEQRSALIDSEYQRLFENRWTTTEDSLSNIDDLRACVTLDGPLERQSYRHYAIGVDIGLKNDRTVVAVCHKEPKSERWEGGDPWTAPKLVEKGNRIVLDRMGVWQGTRRDPVDLQVVEAWILEAARHYRAPVIFDPYQAAGMMQRLTREGVRCEEFTFSSSSVGKLASTVYQLIRGRSLALPADEELLDEFANVKLREASPGVYRMDHDAGKHDDRVIALALAAHHLLQRSEPQSVTFGRVVDTRLRGRR